MSQNQETKNMAGLYKAIDLAVKAHSGQYRRNGEPYICHLFRVLQFVLDHSHDLEDDFSDYRERMAIAAILHDTIEDTPVTYEKIYDFFGKLVADLVLTLSRKDGEIYADFIQRIKQEKTGMAAVIKLADLRDNMRDSKNERYEKAWKVLTDETD